MGYPLRDFRPNKTHHTCSRCIEKKELLKKKMMKDMFLKQLKKAQKKYKFELIAFTIMNNHFHLVIRTIEGGATVSVILQFVKSQFAQKYNRIMDRTGPFWNERYKDKIVELSKDPEKYILNLLLYLGYNPVKSHIVADPRYYKYSSFNCYISEDYIPSVVITLHPQFYKLGKTFNERAKVFLEFEKKYRNYIFDNELNKHFEFTFRK